MVDLRVERDLVDFEAAMDTAGQGGIDPLEVIEGVRDQHALAWDDDSGGGLSAALTFVAPEDGDYRLVIGGALSVGGGQTFADPRFPEMDDPVSYTATIRNRGTNPFNGTLAGTWRVDGTVVDTPSQMITMAPGDTATFTTLLGWDAYQQGSQQQQGNGTD